MNRITIWPNAALAAALLTLAACGGGGSGNGSTPDPRKTDPTIQYNASAQVLPRPNDVAFQGSKDGTLENTGNDSLNALDGYSTTTTATATATAPLASDSLGDGSSVQVFRVDTNQQKAVTGLDAPLQPGIDYAASVASVDRNQRTLSVTPLRPLESGSSYLVVVTDSLKTRSGKHVGASDQYQLLKKKTPLVDGSGTSTVPALSDDKALKLEPLRQLVKSQLAVASGAGIERSDVAASWTFSTQSVGQVLNEVKTQAGNASLSVPAIADTGENTPKDGASIFAGVLTGVPYYLAAPANPNDPAPLNKHWRARNKVAGERNLTGANKEPKQRTTVAIPVLVTIPNDQNGDPACSSCPVTIFQHGITTNRESALGVADSLASVGRATVAIDLPLHGITDTSDPLYAGTANSALQSAYAGKGNIERTFNLDLTNNASGDAGPDGQIDDSGSHFINLPSPLTSRDNLRQAVADLLALTNGGGLAQMSGTLSTVSNGSVALDTSDVDFVGQSLGSIVGIPFLAEATDSVGRAVLSVPGGGVAKLLEGSPTFGPRIQAGLEAKGLTKGTPAYEQILGTIQAAVDTGDPLNYAKDAAKDHDLLMLEVVGGNSSPADQVVENNLRKPYQQGIPSGTVPSPTVGTDPLAKFMGLEQIGPSNSPSAPDNDVIVRFTAGAHSSLVSPDNNSLSSPQVTKRMQTIMGAYLKTGSTDSIPSGVVAPKQ